MELCVGECREGGAESRSGKACCRSFYGSGEALDHLGKEPQSVAGSLFPLSAPVSGALPPLRVALPLGAFLQEVV